MSDTPDAAAPTTGERIAAEFSRDKVHLTDAEQRRLAGMIDATRSGIPDDAFCFFMDGNQHCVVRGNFINLQESPAGFGDSKAEALLELHNAEHKEHHV